jgi:predicted nucleic acid-binding protein
VIVADASAIVDVLLDSEAGEVTARLFDADETLHAPHLLDVEVVSAVRRMMARRAVVTEHGSLAVALLPRLPITRYPHEPLLPRMWELRDHLTAYDAAYVALAEALDAPLITRDAKLARTSGHRAAIELL